MAQEFSQQVVLLMTRIQNLERQVNGLESRIEVEIKFGKMAHDACNIYHRENSDLWHQVNDLKKQVIDLNKIKHL